MFHDHLDNFQKPPLGGRPDTKPPRDHATPNSHDRRFTLVYRVWGLTRIEKSSKKAFGWGPGHVRLHTTTLEAPWPHYMMFEGVLRRPFGHVLSGSHHFHGHGPRLAREAAPKEMVVYTTGPENMATKWLGWGQSWHRERRLSDGGKHGPQYGHGMNALYSIKYWVMRPGSHSPHLHRVPP